MGFAKNKIIKCYLIHCFNVYDKHLKINKLTDRTKSKEYVPDVQHYRKWKENGEGMLLSY